MRISSVISGTLCGVLGVGSTGCPFWLRQCPEKRPFRVAETITMGRVDAMLDSRRRYAEHGRRISVDDLTCADFCRGTPLDGHLSISSCEFDVDGYTSRTEGAVTADGGAGPSARTNVVGQVTCAGEFTPDCPGGRRPLGHIEACVAGPRSLGRSLAELAHLEAASVVAFSELAGLLGEWGAPRGLIARCIAAAADEVRHAAVIGRLAAAHGAVVPAVRQRPQFDGPAPAKAALLTAAMHNATEGCVEETWGALLAHYQAAHATNDDVRAAYSTIAIDETRHAQLAWDLHQWFLSRLRPADRARVEHRRREAIAALPDSARASATAPPELGMPGPALAGRLADEFETQLATAL